MVLATTVYWPCRAVKATTGSQILVAAAATATTAAAAATFL